jgi:hypothetical protein
MVVANGTLEAWIEGAWALIWDTCSWCDGVAPRDHQWYRSPIRTSVPSPFRIRTDGLTLQWNHLGHYALIQPLLPLMIKTSEEPDSHVRIINVSSVGTPPSLIPPHKLQLTRNRS